MYNYFPPKQLQQPISSLSPRSHQGYKVQANMLTCLYCTAVGCNNQTFHFVLSSLATKENPQAALTIKKKVSVYLSNCT